MSSNEIISIKANAKDKNNLRGQLVKKNESNPKCEENSNSIKNKHKSNKLNKSNNYPVNGRKDFLDLENQKDLDKK